MTNLGRRAFLRGRLGETAQSKVNHKVRLPWAREFAEFADRCTRCGECVQACPEQIVIKGDGGFPEVDFRQGECTFCGACETACPTGALDRQSEQALPWSIQARISVACLANQNVVCRTCAENCDSEAIHFVPAAGGMFLPSIRADQCTGCGACVAPCPVQAISAT